MFARMVARVRKAARKRILSILLSGEQLQLLKKPKKYPAVRRRVIGSELGASLNWSVAHGPFAGLFLSESSLWGADVPAMLLGLYEQEVVAQITSRSDPWDLLINVGAASGYFAVGCLASGDAARCIAFEADPRSREILRSTAMLNGVLDRLEIRGTAGEEDLLRVALPPNTIALIDIEGQEFDVMTNAVLEHLRRTEMIVELHDWAVRQEGDVERLVMAARNTGFLIDELATGPRNPSAIPEIAHLNDDDRWIICSEGRQRPGRWLRLIPR